MTDHVPDEGEVKDAWVDFRVDHTNQPLKYDEAVAQYEAFLVKVKAERWIEAVRNRGHQIKKGS
jgi:hypothetical protein